MPIINDSLIGGVLVFGSIFGGALTGLSSALLAYFVYANQMWQIAALLGFFVGFAMVTIVCEVVQSCVITLLVCFAENAEALRVTKPNEYFTLTQTIGERCEVMPQHSNSAAGYV